jgi:hypothetical protein
LPVLEAFVGALVLVALAGAFTVAGDGGTPARERQLEAYAADAARLLDEEPGGVAGRSRLRRLAGSRGGFEAAAPGTRRRLEAALPPAVLFRVVTPHGTVGYPRPPSRVTGIEIRETPAGTVRVAVWYA